MQLTRLGPLHSNMIAYSIAACLLLTSRTLIQPSIFAYAAEERATPELNHNSHPLVPLALSQGSAYLEDGSTEGNNDGYVPDFAYFGRSLLGRQAAEVGKLKNDEKLEADINPDSTVFFMLEKSELPTKRDDEALVEALDASGAEHTSGTDAIETGSSEGGEADGRLSPRQSRRRVWISANTCRQPMPQGGKELANGPQLVLYVSTSVDNQKPGPDSTANLVTNSTGIKFNSGFASIEVNTTSDVYIGVHAPKLDADWFGSWHFEIAASAERSYHSHDDKDPFLYMVDTDSESTLFITYNLTDSDKEEDVEEWKKENYFSMYAFPAGGRSPVTGMENSVCALEQKFNTTNNLTVGTAITTKFGSGFPKRQFDVHGLDNNQTYNGYLVVQGDRGMPKLPGARRVGGGGMVFKQFTWTTKAGMESLTCTRIARVLTSSR
jgi:calcium channel MID1